MAVALWRRTLDQWRQAADPRWYDWAERAAIMEVDGKVPREEAEYAAWQIVSKESASP